MIDEQFFCQKEYSMVCRTHSWIIKMFLFLSYLRANLRHRLMLLNNYYISELFSSFPFVERMNIKLILRPAKRKILIRCKPIIIFSDHKKHKHDMGTKNYLFPSLTSSCFTRKFVVMKNLIMHQEEENDQITLLH